MDIKEALTLDGLKYFYTKYIKPLKTGAFSTVVNNATTTVANTVLDGRMGKTLADKDANLQNQINTLNSSLKNKIIHGTYKDVDLMVLNPDITFSNGNANVEVLNFDELIGKTMINAVAQLKEASTAVITSCRVLNSTTIQIKCINISGTGFNGKIALTIFAFVV